MKNVALITGASSGLGKQFAIIHAQRGGDLVLIARREDKLRELEQELTDKYRIKVLVISKDLTAVNAANEIKKELDKSKIEPEYLINNAGFGGIGKFGDRNWKRRIVYDCAKCYGFNRTLSYISPMNEAKK